MSRRTSVRLAGWRGGKLAGIPPVVVAEALRAGLRGRRRRRIASALVDEWHRQRGDCDEIAFVDLALLLRLSRPHESSTPWCAIDIELGADSTITEIGVAVPRPDGDGHVVAAGTVDDVEHVNEIISGRWLLAHNGHDHDFPRLADAGVVLPDVCIDSLRWSWLAWPTAESHALGALWEAQHSSAIDPAEVHHAGADALLLIELWHHLIRTVSVLPSPARGELVRSLQGVESGIVLERLLGAELEEWVPKPAGWQPLTPTAPRPSRVTSQATGAIRNGDVVVTRSLKDLVARHDDIGLYAAAHLVLDVQRVRGAAPSWSRAVAVALLEGARGAIELGPRALRSDLVRLARTGDAVAVEGRFLATDPLSAATHSPDRPIHVLDGLDGLLRPIDTAITIPVKVDIEGNGIDLDQLGRADMLAARSALEAATTDEALRTRASNAIGSLIRVEDGWRRLLSTPDPIEHDHGVTLQLGSPVGTARSAVLWRSLLGDQVEIDGPASGQRTWTLLDGMPIAGRRYPGRRTAVMLSLAAARQAAGRSAVVVDSTGGREEVRQAAAGLWRERTDAPLLRPPAWPTVDEASRRLRAPHAALVDAATARRLGEFSDELMLVQPVSPPVAAPAVRRMIDGHLSGNMHDGVGDPFSDLVEPLSAHLTCELAASAPSATVTIGGPIDPAALLHDLLGKPSVITLDETARDSTLYEQLTDRLTSDAARASFSAASVRRATTKLLRPGQELRAFQRAITDDAIAGRDALAVFRTGLGKSLCYQVPALCLAEVDAVTLVISPLLALQRDQVSGLRQRGVDLATMYNSEVAPDVRRAVRRGLLAGFYRMVFVAPEALWNAAILEVLASIDIGLIVIDEAHCISEMGHDFRPDYRTIPASVKRILGLAHDDPLPPAERRPVFLALTGTATPAVRHDIEAALS